MNLSPMKGRRWPNHHGTCHDANGTSVAIWPIILATWWWLLSSTALPFGGGGGGGCHSFPFPTWVPVPFPSTSRPWLRFPNTAGNDHGTTRTRWRRKMTTTADSDGPPPLIMNDTKQWTIMFEKLKVYKKVHGDCLVPRRYRCDDDDKTPLGQWVCRQRHNGVQSAGLRERRRQALDSIGFAWQVRLSSLSTSPAASTDSDHEAAVAAKDASHSWNAMFEKLKAYKEVNGNCTVPVWYQCDDGSKLGWWVVRQRRMRLKDAAWMRLKDAALRERRRQALDAIGFAGVVNERKRQLVPVAGGVHATREENFNARWNFMFEKLKEYKAEHGDCLVPNSYNCTDGSKLGCWVAKQRSLATTDSAMNPLRRRALDSIGFVWQVRVHGRSQKLDDQWNEKFQLLQEYHTKHGDCLVPRVYRTVENKITLGEWVSHQRAKHAAGKLRNDRLIRLESMGFSFRALPDDSVQAKWDRLYERLVRYKRQHGDCLVPRVYQEDRQLGRWVGTLRHFGDYALSADQRAALEEIGFCWRVDGSS